MFYQTLSLLVLLLCPTHAQIDIDALSEANSLASSLDYVIEDLLAASASAATLGQHPKTITSLDSASITDGALDGIEAFLDGIASSLEGHRDLIEATYLQPSTKKDCILPNLVKSDSDQPDDFLYNPLYGRPVSWDCEIKSPESEDTLSQEFFDWAGELMDAVKPDPAQVWQYFGDAKTGNFATEVSTDQSARAPMCVCVL